jgi:hypothetical protein
MRAGIEVAASGRATPRIITLLCEAVQQPPPTYFIAAVTLAFRDTISGNVTRSP